MYKEEITVVVLCFNSEKTITETLNSIKLQTYENINLIINDDCSDDSSIKIINEWIEKNVNRFKNYKLIMNSENKGINYSFDNALNNCGTEWCKFIAADDILFYDCIEKNVEYVMKNNINSIVYSKVMPFRMVNNVKKKIEPDLYEEYYLYHICKKNSIRQYKQLLKKDTYFSPSGFININMYKNIRSLNNKIKNIEDWPLRLLITSSGYKMNYLDEYTVYYRIGNSVSHSNNCFFNTNHIRQVEILKAELIYSNINPLHIFYYLNETLTSIKYYIIINIFKNKQNKATIFLNYIFMVFDYERWKKLLYNFIHKKGE